MVEEGAAGAVQFLSTEAVEQKSCCPPQVKRPRLLPMLVASSSSSVVRSPEVAVSGVNQFHTLE